MKTLIQYTGLLLLCLFHATVSGQGTEEQIKEVNDFNAGKWAVFNTNGHAKAGELRIKLKYPKSWTPKEGERPHIVHKFAHPSGVISALMTVRTIGNPAVSMPTAEDVLWVLSPEQMKKELPSSAVVISAESTTVDGLPACFLEYTLTGNAAGAPTSIIIADWSFIYKSTLIRFVGSVGGAVDQQDQLDSMMTEMLPIFKLMANSIVVENKWK